MYKPSKPFITPLQILHVETKKINGVVTKAYTDGEVINGSFATVSYTHLDVYKRQEINSVSETK